MVGNPTVAQGAVFLGAKPWNERTKSTLAIAREMMPSAAGLPGVMAFPITPPSLGQAFRERQGLLIADAQKHASHHSAVDTQTGFVTRSILTVPIVFGAQCFGCLQAINRLDAQGDISAFEEAHLAAFQQLATMLGIALQNVDLADRKSTRLNSSH